MILTVHQPAYLPWLGYFDKIKRSDVYVYLDSVQFEERSFINRNRIKTPQGPIWLTIPVKSKGHRDSTLRETEIDYSQNWKAKHLKSIHANYKKAPYFDERYPLLEALYQPDHRLLADLCYEHLLFWLEQLGIEKTIVRSRDLPITSKKSQLILDICRHFGADGYLSGALGKDYLDEEAFSGAGVKIEYQDYRHPAYPQLHGEFMPYMGIVDCWMNTDCAGLMGGGGK